MSLQQQGAVATSAEGAIDQHALTTLIQQALELGKPGQNRPRQHRNVIKRGGILGIAQAERQKQQPFLPKIPPASPSPSAP